MPKYKVKQPGFFGGRIYDPEGKRKMLITEKPFPSKGKKEQVPSWLERLPDNAKVEKEVDESEQIEEDKKSIEDASFMGEGEKSPTVETL